MKAPTAVTVLTIIAIAGWAPAASASSPGELVAGESVTRTCADELLAAGADGVATASWVAPAAGKATVELRGGSEPDWDLALFRDGAAVAASTSFTSVEHAAARVERGDRLQIQACRLRGDTGSVTASVDLFEAVDPRPAEERFSLVSVPVGGQEDVERLEALGLDVTHEVGPESATVATYSSAERATLTSHGFDPTTLIFDLVADDAASRRLEDRAAGGGRASALPSGREEYRTYAEYTTEMKDLATANPSLVRSIEIGTTFEGRPIEGVEIAADVNADDDGRPVYLNFGGHHAREWPASEMPIEFALDLVQRYNAADPRVRALLADVRVVIVPIVNVDGFIASRSYGFNPLTDDDPDLTLAQAVAGQAAYIRKNCRPTTPADVAIPCENRTGSGVDLNRNYGAYWGGPGSSTDPTSQGYRGTAPFSEPETQAVHEFTSKLHPTVFITNHTFTDDGKWLRQPGFDAPFLPADGIGAVSPDETAMKDLGDAMEAANGFTSERSYETLGDITGATEDWNYFTQGTYGYTPEARGPNFHGTYANAVVAEYIGGGADNPLGTDDAYLIAGERAASEADHGVIEGTAPAGAALQLRKQFQTPTCESSTCTQGDGPSFTDVLDTRLTAPADGTYEWHVNPSGRPLHPGETWTMSCRMPGAEEVVTEVAVDRGQRVTVDWVPSCGTGAPPGTTPPPGDPDPPAATARRCRGEIVTIVGTAGGDRLRGTSTDDVIFARGGRDRIRAGGGADLVCAGGGGDEVRGGGGADRLFGGAGADSLRGGPGRDTCGDAAGRDRLRSCA